MKKKLSKPMKTGNSDSVLSSIFRSILINLNIDGSKFAKLIEDYIIRSHIPITSRDATSIRGNLRKELLKDTMSWKVFIKGLVLLKIQKVEFIIKLHHHNRMITKHEKIININHIDEDNDSLTEPHGE